MVRHITLQNIIGMIVVLAGLLACQNARPPESAENLYNHMQQENVIKFDEFPQAFRYMKGQHNGTIYANERDTLQLVCSYPNLADEKNRYPLYFMQDNHGRSWSLVKQEKGKYKIYRLEPDAEKDYIGAFCGRGSYVAWMVFMFIIIINAAATKEKERISVNSIIKLVILAFIIGGASGIAFI